MNPDSSTTIDGQLAAFAGAVRGSPHNLLSTRALEELESRHIAESQAFAATLPARARVLDLGTGGGFPGMIIAITRPDLDVTLLDATRKKIEFLEEFAAEAAVSVKTLHGRAEDLQQEHAGSFDVVCARAVASLERLVPWALPFLRPGGTLHAIKGQRWPAELKTALPTIQRLGASVVEVPERDMARPDDASEDPAGPSTRQSTDEPDPDAAIAPRVVIIQAPG